MTENPSRRDSDPHSDNKPEQPELERPKVTTLDDKTKAKLEGTQRRKIFRHFHLQKESLKHIFGSSDWFGIIIMLAILTLIAVVLSIPYSWLYYDMGIQYPLRQFLYVSSSILTVIGAFGIIHYFFPEWYVE